MSKRFIISIIICSALFLVGQLYSQEKIDMQAEEKAIKEVIHNEFKLLRARNWDEFIATWAHKPNTAWIGVSKDGHIFEVVGWENLERFYKGLFRRGPKRIGAWEQRNFLIKISGNLAWAAFDKYTTGGPDSQTMRKRSREFRSLIKEDGQWKILNVTWIGIRPTTQP